VQLLLLALGLLIVACVFVMVVLSVSQPPVLWLLGMAAAPALGIAWLGVYRKRSMGPIADCVTIGCICLIAMAVENRWDGWPIVLLAVAVIFTAGFGSLEHVLLRTAALTAIGLGEGMVDPASFTVAH
jgi:FtsH-binding integral membrane protein